MPTDKTPGAGTGARSTPPIVVAKDKTGTVKDELAVAGAELHLTNTALNRSLPTEAKNGDVGKALEQNGKVQEKVNQAAEDLAEVTELLEEEIQQRQRLEAELAARTGARGMSENG
jgi:phosphoglycerate-specific signal transduction histidine kinase